MNARTLDQLKKQHITNRQPQRGLDGSNKLVKSFVSQVGGGWINERMPNDSELQQTYENCGEYIFNVAIPNILYVGLPFIKVSKTPCSSLRLMILPTQLT